MKYLIATALLLLFASVAYAARFDFSNGQPTITEDGTISDTLQQSRFDFVNGQPVIVFDSTAVETGGGALVVQDVFWFD